MTNKTSEFNNFDSLMRSLIKVSHDELKKKLDAEKEEKKRRPKRPRASGHAAGDKD